jgi:hypothetical protein
MYNRIKDEVIGTMPQPKQQPIINQQPYLNSNELLDLKMEIERMKYEQKLRDIENHYAMMLNKIQSRMDLIESRNNEYDDEPVKEESNEFFKTLSGILPLVIEKMQKQS